ncbi:TDT family transporter [Methanobrevibacter sp.]|uniref:TDT family transporter n=1 Tax=Methanobrevibacter sp. TaxID=66852 RepID=UPI00388EC7D9
MNIIKNIPLPISGLILALLSLGNLLQDIHPALRYLFGTLGVIFLILIILKVILYPDEIKNDFQNPVLVSSSGTFSMSVMLLSTYLLPFIPSIAYVIWIIGIGLHIMLMIYFTYHFIIHNFDINAVYPTYWIVFVGITMAAITSHSHSVEETGFIFFICGFVGMLLSTPVIFYRYIKHRDIPDVNKPLICIFTALFSILIVGYINSAKIINTTFLIGLYSIACPFYIFALYKLIEHINIKFYPSFSAFTFPFVISALATKGICANIGKNNLLNNILIIETVIAIILVIYVLIKYLKFLKIVEK